ncbi:MAG: DUF1080 domain-containing protein [bacterium]
MLRLVVLKCALLCAAILCISGLPGAEESEGWVSCFDGKDFSNWSIQGEQDSFQIVDGEIRTVKGKSGWLKSDRQYEDFDLQLEFKIGRDKNSGVFIHAPVWGRSSSLGMEIQILGDFGREPNDGSSGAIYAVEAASKNAMKPSAEWNSYEISWHDAHLTIRLNEEVIHDIDLNNHPALRDRLRVGYIGLQNHGDEACFKNIRIRPGTEKQYGVAIEHSPRVMQGQRPALNVDRLSILHVVAMSPAGLIYCSGRTGETWDSPALLPGTERAVRHDIFNFPSGEDPLVVWSDDAHVYVSVRNNGDWKQPERISGDGKAFFPTVMMVAQSEHFLAYVEKDNAGETIHLHTFEDGHKAKKHNRLVTGHRFNQPKGIVADMQRDVVVTWGGLSPENTANGEPYVGLVRAHPSGDWIGPLHWLTDRTAAGSVVPCVGLDCTFAIVRPVREGKQVVFCQSTPGNPIDELGPDTAIGVWSDPNPPVPICRPLGSGYVAAWTRRYGSDDALRVGWSWFDGLRWNPKEPFPGCEAAGDPDSGLIGQSVYVVWPGTDGWIYAERITLAEME